MRTARSRNSGDYLFNLLIALFSQEIESPVNPGRFKEGFVQSLTDDIFLHFPEDLSTEQVDRYATFAFYVLRIQLVLRSTQLILLSYSPGHTSHLSAIYFRCSPSVPQHPPSIFTPCFEFSSSILSPHSDTLSDSNCSDPSSSQ